MFSEKNLMIIIIAALCLISLASAEEKKEGRIEPKLVYETRFDFEIEQGKISDDGSIFPTIFVTKEHEVLYIDSRGNKKKTYRVSNKDKIFLSKDGKYVGIVHYPNKWWEVGATIELYNYKGEKKCRIIPKDKLEPVLIIGEEAKGIVVQKLGMDELEGIDFYSWDGTLVTSYGSIIPYRTESISIDLHLTGIGCYTPYSRLPVIYSPGVADNYLLCRANSSLQDGSWIVLFSFNGELLLVRKMYGDNIPEFPAVSNDGQYIIYERYTPYELAAKLGLKNDWARETVKICNLINGTCKEIDATVDSTKKTQTSIIMNFTDDSKGFWIIKGNRFYFGDVENGEVSYSWATADTTSIVYAFVSPYCNYVLCTINDGRIVVLNKRGEVVLEKKFGSKIIDAKINEEKHMIIILTQSYLYKYTW